MTKAFLEQVFSHQGGKHNAKQGIQDVQIGKARHDVSVDIQEMSNKMDHRLKQYSSKT